MTEHQTGNSGSRVFPAWQASLLLFALLIMIVLAYFYWQVRQLNQTFLNQSLEHSRMLAGIIERNARSALLSQEAVEQIIRIFLGNTSRFVDYLDGIEPFSENELAEFALENGLTGIRVTRRDGSVTEGPQGWIDDESSISSDPGILQHITDRHLYLLTLPRAGKKGYILVGLTATHIEELHEQVSLSRLLEALSGLAGVQYVRIEPPENTVPSDNNIRKNGEPVIRLLDRNGLRVAETRLPFRGEMLVVGMDTRHFVVRAGQIWQEFSVFGAVLAFLGLFFSWLLHRSQTLYLRRIQSVERELARQREDAALGRAAAAITHEIRNPLNAISMGLQRLQIEADELPEEYQNLVMDMLRALGRTNSIVSDIRRYARPLEPRRENILLEPLIGHILSLYHRKISESGIRVNLDNRYNGTVNADPQMMEQVLENLVKNSIEAQPDGGFIRIRTEKTDDMAVVSVENSGFSLPAHEVESIMEPYFTTKTRGTGLGLAIVRKIVQAHDGRMELRVPKENILNITIYLEA